MASSVQEIINGSQYPFNIPANVNPFSYVLKEQLDHFSRPFSRCTAAVLGILLVFHSLIVIFCAFILIITCVSGSKQSRWVIRKLYIKDEDGHKVYNKPLYFLNAGILMNLSQLLCSCVAQVFMWIQIRSSQSADYAVHAQIMPCFGLIYSFETLSYWSMTHCFLVTIYFSRGFTKQCNSGLTKWISPPFLINFFFIGFPILVIVITVVLMSWTTVTYDRYTSKVSEFIQILNRGSSAWQILNDVNQSEDVKSRIGAQILQITSNLRLISDEKDTALDKFARAFRFSQEVWLALVCMSCVVFVRMFFSLIEKYRRSGRQTRLTRTMSRPDWLPTWLKRENFDDPFSGKYDDTQPRNFSVILPNRQFFYLLLRAIGVFLSMVTQMSVLLIGVWKGKDVVTHKNWKGITTWILTLSSVWSAAPIAWQCWKLYVDESQARSTNVEKIDLPPRETATEEPDISELDMKTPDMAAQSVAEIST